MRAEENALLTQTAAGTPMGELLRRYWWPITSNGRLLRDPVVPVRLLGEDMTLFRDKSGRLGLIDRRCAHRRVDLSLGIPTQEGLRCMYHGWMYDADGQCIDQPTEPEGSHFSEKVQIKAYPVQELGGLIFAYLGPEPAPLLPRWDVLVWDNTFRHVGAAVLNANWLQCMENSVDTSHTEYTHGHWFEYHVLDRSGGTGNPAHDAIAKAHADSFKVRHLKTEWMLNEWGIQKYRLREGEAEDTPDWTVGHPLVFPYFVRLGGKIRSELQIRVPMDDEHTLHLDYMAYCPGPDVEAPQQDYVPYFEHPLFDETGRPIADYVLAQDLAAWWGQGAVADRENERLGVSDRGVIMFRKLLTEQMQIVQDGGDPMNVFRDPAANERIDLPVNVGPGPVARAAFSEKDDHRMTETEKGDVTAVLGEDATFKLRNYHMDRYSPALDKVLEIYRRYEEVRLQRA